ncbi:MAG: hypothetical protein PVH61_39935 [Candidatus Aminicenantes bacterium]|jgi:hypothetical protein
MFKRKESRDTVLLVFMAVVTLAFLLYMFLPSGKGKEKTNDKKNKNSITNKIKKSPGELKLPEETEPTEISILEAFSEKIVAQLNSVFADIMKSEDPFRHYNTESLKTLLLNSENNLVEKLYKFSFFDLNDIARLKFPESYSDSLKFNLFVALFLIKIQEEFIEEAFLSLPKVEVEKLVDFDIYGLLDFEIEKDYQLIPVLFYFKHLVLGLNLYPGEDVTLFFKEGIENLRDLSDSKCLVKIKELLAFSQRKEKFRIEWVEEDGILADDKKVYKNLSLKIFNFLKQDYLIFPDAENNENNRWIKELCKADPGNIELELLSIQNEDPSQQSRMHKIVYTPINAQFVVLLNGHTPTRVEEFLHRMVVKRKEDFLKNFTIIDFSLQDTNPKVFRKKLDQFGDHLKNNTCKGQD